MSFAARYVTASSRAFSRRLKSVAENCYYGKKIHKTENKIRTESEVQTNWQDSECP